MSAMCMAIVPMLLMLVAPALSGTMSGPLRYDFYNSTCPKAEKVIRQTTEEIIAKDPTLGAAFLNMFYFDCFSQV